jgi:hypothetical protein
MTRAVAVAVLTVACSVVWTAAAEVTTAYGAPAQPPSFRATPIDGTAKVWLQANVSYVTDPGLVGAWVFSWHWSESFSMYLPDNCTNHRTVDFNINNPVLWAHIWNRLDHLNSSAISGEYLAWPVPSLPWTVWFDAQEQVVVYDGVFDIGALVQCAGTHIRVSVQPSEFVYAGTFYITWVQPVTAWLPGLPLTATYSTRPYPFAFEVGISRLVDATDASSPYPDRLTSYLLQMGWQLASGENNHIFRYWIVVETLVPASRLASSGAILHYNRALPAQAILAGATYGLQMVWNASLSSVQCSLVPATGECAQTWVFHSTSSFDTATMTSSIGYNDSFTLVLTLQSCSTSDLTTCQSYDPVLPAAIPLSMQVYLAKQQVIHVLRPFASNVTFWTTTNFTVEKLLDEPYGSSDSVIVRHAADLSDLGNDYYELWIQNVYVCRPISGGVAPYWGYDTAHAMWRKGCAEPEVLDGRVNIPSDQIWIVAINTTGTEEAALFTTYRKEEWSEAVAGASFALFPIPDSVMPSFYVHVESALFLPGTTANGHLSHGFRTLGHEHEQSGSRGGNTVGRLSGLSRVPLTVGSVVTEITTATGTGTGGKVLDDHPGATGTGVEFIGDDENNDAARLGLIIGLSVTAAVLVVVGVGAAASKGWITCELVSGMCRQWSSFIVYRAVPTAPVVAASAPTHASP